MARYFKATVTGITGPTWVSWSISGKHKTYVDPSDDEVKILGTAAKPNFVGKKVTGSVRTDVDHNALAGTTVSNVTMTLTEASGGSDITKLFPTLAWLKHKVDVSADDVKPAQFQLDFEAQVPS